MRTTAIPSEDGTHYVLNGEKIWISNAGYAGVLTVFAKVPVEVDGKPKQRATAFIVDAHAPGVTLGHVEEKMGIKASDTFRVVRERAGAGRRRRLPDRTRDSPAAGTCRRVVIGTAGS
jgi:alkylation response protein AidB-like acyl-CoA dehydrogenase